MDTVEFDPTKILIVKDDGTWRSDEEILNAVRLRRAEYSCGNTLRIAEHPANSKAGWDYCRRPQGHSDDHPCVGYSEILGQ